ncbi:MAG: hypothetical protein OEV93_01840 [Candidatus Moranbacteria bacterium]|nr:hypothetical protein [Candidatus Moranbacteria bacterium]
MSMEIPEAIREKENILQGRLEISLESEGDFEKLEEWLREIIDTEEAEQCVFVLRSMQGMDFRNQCQDATQKFGTQLNTQFGGEESFFDLVPSAKFSDVRTHSPMDKTGSRDNHHSVALLEMNPDNKEAASLVFDLTYGHASGRGKRNAISVFSLKGDAKQIMEALKDHYGGSWKVNFELNRKTGEYRFKI